MFCQNCGHEIDDNADVCVHCGCFVKESTRAKVESNDESIVRKGWFLAIICFFLGCLGIHRFMVGKVGTGILWLITFGVFGLGWLIDLIMLLCSSFTDKDGNRIKFGV